MSLKSLSKAMICSVIALYLSACTDDEQAKMIERQKVIDAAQKQEQPAQPAADTSQNSEPAPASDQSPPVEEATPEPKTKLVYHFTSNSESRQVNCNQDGTVENCGISFENCGSDGSNNYYCQIGVRTWTTEEPDDN